MHALPIALDVERNTHEDGARTESARIVGTALTVSIDASQHDPEFRGFVTTSVHHADALTVVRAWRLGSGSYVASLSTGADDVDLYATDPRALAAALTRAAAALLDAAAEEEGR